MVAGLDEGALRFRLGRRIRQMPTPPDAPQFVEMVAASVEWDDNIFAKRLAFSVSVRRDVCLRFFKVFGS